MYSKRSAKKKVSTVVNSPEKSVKSHRRMGKSFESCMKIQFMSDIDKIPVVVSSHLYDKISKKDTKSKL